MKTNKELISELTKEDFMVDKWDTDGIKYYNRFKKLTSEQIEKYFEASKFIGFEMEYLRGSKIRKCILMAVTLPNQKVVAYPLGEIHDLSGKEFATKYSSHPFDFRIALLNDKGEITTEYWSSKIENLDLSKASNKKLNFICFPTYKDSSEVYY